MSYTLPLLFALCLFASLWPVSLWRRDASIVDHVWAPGLLAQVLIAVAITEGSGSRRWMLITLLAVWAGRLGFVLTRRRLRERREDRRYTALRSAWGEGFWWKSFFIVFLTQALIQWGLAVTVIAGIGAADMPFGPVAVIGLAIALAGLTLETIADRQLDAFKRSTPGEALCDTGLRAWMRHPNYSGEILFWTGIGLVVAGADPLMALVAPCLVTVLLTKVSGAPILDERLGESRAGYAHYRRRVPAFIPDISVFKSIRDPGSDRAGDA